MASVFTRILRGELPARFVHRDDRVAAFLTIAPVREGHTLVVPVDEVDHWDDLEPDLAAQCLHVAQRVAKAVKQVYRPTRVGLVIAGLEVPHAHLHVIPFDEMAELDFRRVRSDTPAEELDDAAERIRAALG